jgi:hypothetical protein
MKCHSRCIVYPSVVKLKKQIKGRYNQFSPNLSLSYNIKGLGFDLYSIRDYITGDELKRIHWPVSARFCQLMVKEFNTYSKNHVNILLDNNRFSSIGKGRENSFEYLVKIAVSLCRKFFDEKISMKLIYQEKSGFRMINYNHFEDFMLFFAGITADGKYSVNDLIRWFIQEQAIKGSCLIISVDPEISLDLINSVNKLKKGSDIILIKGSDFRYSDEKIYESDRYDRNIQMLCKSGINLQVISKGDDLSSCLVS